MKATDLRRYAAVLGIVAGGIAMGISYYVHVKQPHFGPSWGFVTSPRLLMGMGVVMILGAILVLWRPAVGGIVMVAAAVVGLVYTYQHQWHRMDLLYAWAAPVILATLAGVLVGYVLGKEIEPIG